jgi:hypothetical protein
MKEQPCDMLITAIMSSLSATTMKVLAGRLVPSLPTLLLLFYSTIPCGGFGHRDLFPPEPEDYDFNILDPNSVFGSPYGGFSRNTRSSLAALPLVMIPGGDVHEEEDHYMQVADGLGREYICRTYNQDDVSNRDLKLNSVFDPVLLKARKEEGDTGGGETMFTTEERLKAAATQILLSLNSLQHVCTQKHMGWWSYGKQIAWLRLPAIPRMYLALTNIVLKEWCFGTNIRQFHVEVSEGTQIKMSDVTHLGRFARRNIATLEQVQQDRNHRHALRLTQPMIEKSILEEELLDKFMLKLVGGEQELGVVTEWYENGDPCPDTNVRRKTTVEYRCCSPDNMQSLKPFIIYKSNPIPSDIAAVAKIDEPKTCEYRIQVCTPLLCEGMAELYENGPGVIHIGSTKPKHKSNVVPPANKKPRKDDESIRDTIDRTLEEVCLRTNTNEWWAYGAYHDISRLCFFRWYLSPYLICFSAEFCHGEHIRQFHEGNVFDPVSGITSRQIESQYFLGYYDEETAEDFPDEDEIKYVVNMTEVQANSKKKNRQRGSGAYFYQEYIDGQECDGSDPDVRTKAGIKRATTVRFFCGPKYEIASVNEDSTCHYVMDVTVPDLCEHPLFQAPEDRKQIIKCSPLLREDSL